MKLIPLFSHGKFTKVDDEDFEFLSQWRWTAKKGKHAWYAHRSQNNKTLYLHRLLAQAPKGMDVDHRDGDGLNNQKSNLRVCTRSENALNRKELNKSNTSGISGVRWHKATKKWLAQITYGGKKIYLGLFNFKEDAAMAVINFRPPRMG